MAIYHCTTKPISRSDGRSSTASSSYRSGEKIIDERTGEIHDYTKKQGVAYSEVLPFKNSNIDRSELWNKAELSEKRKDARVAREFIIALPHELSKEKRQEVAKEFAKYLSDRYSVISDLAIHEPSRKGDDKNHHAHIMITTRKAEIDQSGNITLGEKSNLELSNSKRQSLGLGTTQDEIKTIREAWANIANNALMREGIKERIDHRSFENQEIEQIPTKHEGAKVTNLRRKGVVVGIAKLNDEIKAENEKLKERQPEKIQEASNSTPPSRTEAFFNQKKDDALRIYPELAPFYERLEDIQKTLDNQNFSDEQRAVANARISENFKTAIESTFEQKEPEKQPEKELTRRSKEDDREMER